MHPDHPPVPGQDIYVLPEQSLDLADGPSTVRFISECERIGNIALIIIDTQALATPGSDENSPTEMSYVFGGLSSLANRLGCCILVLHHTPVGTKNEPLATWHRFDPCRL